MTYEEYLIANSLDILPSYPCLNCGRGTAPFALDDAQICSVCHTEASRVDRAAEEAADITLAREAKWDEIKAARERALLSAPTSFGIFQSDPESKANITGKATSLTIMAPEDLPETITWKRLDNSFATLTVAEFNQMSLEVVQHIEATYATSWTLEAQIAAAESIEDVEAITWA